MAAAAVHTNQRPTQSPTVVDVEDLQQQLRDFRIPEFSSPWPHVFHPSREEARKVADEWALYHFHTLVGTKRFSKIMKSNTADGLAAGFYGHASSVWGLEFGMEQVMFVYVLDDEVLHRAPKVLDSASGDREKAHVTGVAQIFLELLLVLMSSFPREKVLEEALEKILAVDEKWGLSKRGRIEKFLAQAAKQPGTVDYSDGFAEVSPLTSAFRNLWKRATSVMPGDWNLRYAYILQRDTMGMFKETQNRILGIKPSISEYIQQRREYSTVEWCLNVGELAEGIQVSTKIYFSPPMQRLIQATNDVVSWHNDIHSFKREMLAGEVNLVDLISKREGCSYNRAAEIVNGMVVDRCKDMSLAAAELRHNANSKQEQFLDSEDAEKYIRLCTNFIGTTHEFHQRSLRFHDKH